MARIHILQRGKGTRNRIVVLVKSFFVTVLLCVPIGLGSTLPTHLANLESSQVVASFNTLRNGIVHIGQRPLNSDSPTAVERWLGTGFTVDYACTVATAKHIFNDADRERLVVRFQLPSNRSTVITWGAKILYEDPDTDLAFLRGDGIDGKPCTLEVLYAFDLISEFKEESLAGEKVLIIGHPVLASGRHIDIPVARHGIVASAEIRTPNFKVTEQSLENMKSEGVPSDVLKKVEAIKNQNVTTKEGFLRILNATIGEEQTVQYRSLILKHTVYKMPILLLDLTGAPGFSGSPVILRKNSQVIGVIYGPGPIPRVFGFEWATPITKKDFTRADKSSPLPK